MTSRRKHSEGFSLVEVLIAIVILGTVSVVLLNGLVASRATSDKVSINALAFSQLDAATEAVNVARFRTCTSLVANPYSGTLDLPPRVSLVSVEGMTRGGSWVRCGPAAGGGDSVWKYQGTAIQRIKIKAPYTNAADGTPNAGEGAKFIERTLLKTMPAGSYASGYSVKINDNTRQDVMMGPIPGPGGTSASFVLTAENLSQTCFEVLSSDFSTSGTLNPVITNECVRPAGQNATVKVTLPEATTLQSGAVSPAISAKVLPGTYNVDIGAYNFVTGDWAKPATLRVTVKPSLQVSVAYQSQSGTTVTDGVQCSSFAGTKATATVSYCIVKLSVAQNTGSGQGIIIKSFSDSGCTAKARSAGFNGDVYVKCSFFPAPNTSTQAVYGSETEAVNLYLWREAATGTTAEKEANKLCSGGGSSLYKQNVSITLNVRDYGLDTKYAPFFSLPLAMSC